MNSDFLEARRFYLEKIKMYKDTVEGIFSYLNAIQKLFDLIYRTESDTPTRRGRINYFARLQHQKILEGLVALQFIVEYQSELLKLYSDHFVVGNRYYFF